MVLTNVALRPSGRFDVSSRGDFATNSSRHMPAGARSAGRTYRRSSRRHTSTPIGGEGHRSSATASSCAPIFTCFTMRTSSPSNPTPSKWQWASASPTPPTCSTMHESYTARPKRRWRRTETFSPCIMSNSDARTMFSSPSTQQPVNEIAHLTRDELATPLWTALPTA